MDKGLWVLLPFVAGGVFGLLTHYGSKWWSNARKRYRCFHHHKETSWISSRLINNGAGKMFICDRCGKVWT